MKLYRREKYLRRLRGFYHDTQMIKVITGVRRCGKSCIMESIAGELAASGVNPRQIVKINLDEKRYMDIDTSRKLEELIDKSRENQNDGEITYLFIDEIQNVRNFEPLLNAYRESGECSIFVTGSNSYLLSGDLVTKLTGRYIELNVYPLTFDEYLGMKTFLGQKTSENLREEFDKYIREGGFPQTLYYENYDDKTEYIRNVVSEIMQKDIRKRVKINGGETFEAAMTFIMNNFGCTFSAESLLREFKKAGLAVKRETLARYIRILTDSKILCKCARFDQKSKKSLRGEEKYYLADLSFYFATNADNRINYGPVLENIVYIHALSNGYSASVGKIGNFECDFILRDNSAFGEYAYVQVAMTILSDRATEDREYRPLEAIRDNYPKFVMTRDTLLQKRNGIRHVNIEEFLAQGKRFS